MGGNIASGLRRAARVPDPVLRRPETTRGSIAAALAGDLGHENLVKLKDQIQAEDRSTSQSRETIIHRRDIVPHLGGIGILRLRRFWTLILPEHLIQGGSRPFDA